MSVVAADPFASTTRPYDGSCDDLVPVTPSDTDELAAVGVGILISVDGALRVTTAAGVDRTYPAGTFGVNTIIPLRVRKVWATGTGATGIFNAV